MFQFLSLARIVDGQASIEGGMNIADEYAFGGTDKPVTGRDNERGWRDADVKIEGPAVGDAQAAFLANWGELGDPVSEEDAAAMSGGGAAHDGGAGVRVVHHRPDEDGDDNIENLYLQSIRSARTTINIENAYFLPSEEIRMELMAAAQRGVQVNIMTNSHETNDNGAVADASRFFFDELVASGVNIMEREGSTLHAKTASFDGAFSIMGSANLNGRSRGQDSEVVTGISSSDVAAQLDRRFEAGRQETHAVSPEELEGEDMFTNVRQAVFSAFEWTF